MKLNFQHRLVLSSLVIFAIFTATIVVFVQHRAVKGKVDALTERLDAYADVVGRQALGGGSVDSLLKLMPRDMRLTLIDRSGRVVYDNDANANVDAMDNHSGRPEIAAAVAKGRGSQVRLSATNGREYLYYAKDSGHKLIVRVALPYDITVRSFLKPDNIFLYFVIALFAVGVLSVYYIGRHFGRSVRHLRDFSTAMDTVETPRFPDNEFGEIAGRLAENFGKISASERQIAMEREKLLLHIQTSAEGVCFFNADRTVAFYNGLFVQYFNMLCNGRLSVGSDITDDGCFQRVNAFLNDRGNDDYFEARIVGSGKEFMLRLNIFEDGSFETILTDVTAREKNRRLKQEMTGNIAHELRTPVTSIRGFLEILKNNELDETRSREYLERAYSQTKTLSELIADMSLLTRIDEKLDSFEFTGVDIARLVDKVRADRAAALAEKNITLTADLPTGLTVRGNEGLLYSIFRNLTDNVIAHAGREVEIHIGVVETGEGTVRFTFADTGHGIEDERHLERLFERFYRVNEGRTRDTGGSGIGLSIVKNAVQFHGGHIMVRNRGKADENGAKCNGGGAVTGLEFIFTLPR